MRLSTALLVSFVSAALATPLEVDQPVVTPSPVHPKHESLLKLRMLQYGAGLFERDGDLAFCYGENSICSNSNDLFDKCNSFDSLSDLTQWYQCICENGYVSTREACGWCDIAYGISEVVTGIDELNSGQCSSHSFTIAPIPQSVLAIQSTYNSTWTGQLLGGGGAPKTSASATATSEGGSAPSTTSKGSSGGRGSLIGQGASATAPATSPNSAVTSATVTFNGGNAPATVTQTVTGGGNAATTTTTGSSGSGATPGFMTGSGTFFSILAFGFVVVCLV